MALGSKGASCKSIPDSGDTRNLSNVDKLYRPNPWVSEWIWESTRKQNGRKQLRATAFAPSRSIWPTAQVVGDLLMVFPRPAPEWTQSQFWWTLFQHAGSTSCIDLATALVMSWNWLGRFHDKHGFWLFFKCRYSDNTWKLFLTLKTHEIALLSVVHYQYTEQPRHEMLRLWFPTHQTSEMFETPVPKWYSDCSKTTTKKQHHSAGLKHQNPKNRAQEFWTQLLDWIRLVV